MDKLIVLVGVLCMSLVACHSPDWGEIMEEQFPYGIWRSDTEYYIRMKENDVYEVCNSSECNIGQISWTNPHNDGLDDYGPYLIDFDKKPIGLKILEESRALFLYQRSGYHKARHPSFFQHQQNDPSLGFCKLGPCKPFGGYDKPQYHFYLVKE